MPGSRAADPVIIVWANLTIFVQCYLVLPIFFWLGFCTKIFIKVVGLVAVSVLVGCAARGWGQESHSDVEKTFRDL